MVVYITELTDENFKEFVSNKIVLIDAYAVWCKPCSNLSPIIDQLSIEYLDKVSVGKINVDDCPITTKDLEIRSIPSIFLYKDGEIVDRLVGSVSKQKIIEIIEKNM